MKPAKEAEVVETKPAAGTAVSAPTETQQIQTLLTLAVDKQVPVETLERLTKLYESMQDRAAEKALIEALGAFQSECHTVVKDKEARDAERNGGKLLYRYASLNGIAKSIGPALQRHGLAYSFDMEESEKGLTIFCTISHIGGARKKAHFFSPVMPGTSLMNVSQRHGGTVTFGQRYALIAALGLTTADEDTDSRTADDHAAITAHQAIVLSDLLSETKSDRVKFLAIYGVQSVEDLPASCYAPAKRMLEAKKKAS